MDAVHKEEDSAVVEGWRIVSGAEIEAGEAVTIVLHSRENYFPLPTIGSTLEHQRQNRALPAKPSSLISYHRCKPSQHARLLTQLDSWTRLGQSLTRDACEIGSSDCPTFVNSGMSVMVLCWIQQPDLITLTN